LLRGFSVSVLLGAFSKTGQIVKHMRDESLTYLDEPSVLTLLRKQILQVKQAQERSKERDRARRSAEEVLLET
jgi:hypothetical protein